MRFFYNCESGKYQIFMYPHIATFITLKFFMEFFEITPHSKVCNIFNPIYVREGILKNTIYNLPDTAKVLIDMKVLKIKTIFIT